jgi:GTP cyclohydrolase FolE2
LFSALWVLKIKRKRGTILKTEKRNVKMAVKLKTEGSAMSKNSEAVKKYYAENCIEFKIRQAKADAQAVKEYAAEHGCSVQALFLAAVQDYMKQGKTPEEVKRGRKKKED